MQGSRTQEAGEVGGHFGLRAPTLQACKVRSYHACWPDPAGESSARRRRGKLGFEANLASKKLGFKKLGFKKVRPRSDAATDGDRWALDL